MAKWQIFIGRVTLFPQLTAPAALPSPALLFRQVWGNDPDAYQKAANPMAPSFAQGKVNEFAATCAVHPTRIDLQVMGQQGPESVGTLTVVEDTAGLHGEMAGIIHAVGSMGINCSRAAIYIQLVTLTPDVKTANQVLIGVIPKTYGIQIQDEEDFIFQVNRPYKSAAVPTLEMNSILKWSLEKFQVIKLIVPPGGIASPASGSITNPENQEFITASLSFDVNNRPARLGSHDQESVLSEALERVSAAQKELGFKLKGW